MIKKCCHWKSTSGSDGKRLFVHKIRSNRHIFNKSVLTPIFYFSVHTGSRFPVSKMSSHHYDQTWAYAVWISKIRLLVLTIWAKSLFPSRPEVDFQWQQFSVITTIKPENIPFKFWKSVHKYPGYEPKTCFRRSFSIFLAKPEVDSKNERQRTLFCIKLELLAFEFWKSVH